MNVPDEALAVVVERAQRVPDRYRAFTEPRYVAQHIYQIPEQLLDRLLDLGFPHSGVGTALAFYSNDLRNACEELRLPSPQRGAIRMMGAALEAGAAELVARRTVEVHARCPQPGHAGDCGFTLADAVAGSSQVTQLQRLHTHHHRLTVELPGGRTSHFEGADRDLAHELDGIAFARLPRELANDQGFLLDARLADCQSGARFLVDRAPSFGVRARLAFGILLTQPFSNTHSWAEFEVADEWMVADPLSLAVLARWGVLGVDDWPVHRSPYGTHWRLGSDVDALVRHAGQPAPVSLVTRHG